MESEEEFRNLQEAGQSSNVRSGNRLVKHEEEDQYMADLSLMWRVTSRSEY